MGAKAGLYLATLQPCRGCKVQVAGCTNQATMASAKVCLVTPSMALSCIDMRKGRAMPDPLINSCESPPSPNKRDSLSNNTDPQEVAHLVAFYRTRPGNRSLSAGWHPPGEPMGMPYECSRIGYKSGSIRPLIRVSPTRIRGRTDPDKGSN